MSRLSKPEPAEASAAVTLDDLEGAFYSKQRDLLEALLPKGHYAHWLGGSEIGVGPLVVGGDPNLDSPMIGIDVLTTHPALLLGRMANLGLIEKIRPSLSEGLKLNVHHLQAAFYQITEKGRRVLEGVK